jgi:NodT family efflux transporter outer membrane factor (OMF) lipoprotein
MLQKFRLALAANVAVFLSGCASGPNYTTPHIWVPANFELSRALGSVAKASASTIPPESAVRWWETLHDPELSALVQQAIVTNPDIGIALARVQEAREQEIAVAGVALPQGNADGAIAGGSGTDSVKGRIPPSIDAGVNTTGFREITRVIGFDAGWELDLFGKYRRELEAARYETEAAIEARNAVLIVVVADVARNYIELRGLQTRIKVAQENIAREQKTVDLVNTRFDRGLSNELDVTLAKRELATLQAQLPPLIAGVSDVEARIALLLGTYSGEVSGELDRPREIPRTPERLRPGQPVDLLRRRPDIRQAERQLASATALVGASIADLFPRVLLTAGVGAQAGQSAVSSIPKFGGAIWSAGPGAYWSLLDFGQLDALIDVQEFRAYELLMNYRKTVLAALGDVESAIDQYRAALQRLRKLEDALAESRRAENLARERYERGLTDFLNVLDAQREEYGLEDQVVIAKQSVVIQFVTVYKALGGGWELYESLPPIPKPQPAILATFRRLSQPGQTWLSVPPPPRP